eukprot:gene10371-11482_t
MTVEYYHTTDPVENFFLRVVVREISRPRGSGSQQFFFDEKVRWQQKLYSPADVADYVVNKSDSRGSVAQMETRNCLARLERDGQNVRAMLRDPMVVTYIDRDNRHAQEEVTNGVTRKVPETLLRGSGCKTMSICLVMDLEVDRLLEACEKDPFYRPRDFFEEHLLMEVKIYQDGLVEISPGLSKPLTEPRAILPLDLGVQFASSATSSSAQSNCQSLNLFLDDLTVRAGQRLGFAMSSYRLKSSRSGAEFEFFVFNDSELVNPVALEGFLFRQRLLDSLHSQENVLHTNWKQDPPQATSTAVEKNNHKVDYETICWQLELQMAEGFEADSLFVVYAVQLPEGFRLRTGNLTDGAVNQRGAGLVTKEEEEGMLQGCTHVGRLNPRLPCQLAQNCFLGRQHSFVAGTAYFIVSCAAIIVGLEYLIFVALALVLLCFLYQYNTFPGRLLLLLPDDLAPSVNHFVNYLPAADYFSKQSERQKLLQGSAMHREAIVLNHLVNFSCDYPASSDDSTTTSSSSSSSTGPRMPEISFQVYRSDGSVTECIGYGNFSLPARAGGISLAIPTVMPVAGAYHNLCAFFLGTYAKFKSPFYMSDVYGALDRKEVVSGKASGLNRFGLVTQSSGTLHVRGQAIVTRRRPSAGAPEANTRGKVTDRPLTLLAKQEKRLETRKTVEEILSAFRSTNTVKFSDRLTRTMSASKKQDLLQKALRPNALSGQRLGGGGRPSVQEIIQSLGSSRSGAIPSPSTPPLDKVASILAKVRAKAAAASGAAGGESKAVELASLQGRIDAINRQRETREAAEEDKEDKEDTPLLSSSNSNSRQS